jgi:hypothetical protein
VVNIPLACRARCPLHWTAVVQAVGMPTETPTTPPTLWPQATPSPVSGGEGVIPSPAWAGRRGPGPEGKGEGGKVSQDFL